MGNTNQPGSKVPGDLGSAAMKGWPVLYHNVHSENVQLSLDRRRAKRIESFCKGICFGNRPIACSERVYLKFAEVSTSWSGVVRFGFTSNDPANLNPAELPRYACPDLTNKPGFWAKALSERYADTNNTLFFYYTRNGDVMFGINNEEKGVFFSGVNTSGPLWTLIDVYGNTTAMEFVDGHQLNNLSPGSGVPPSTVIGQDLPQASPALGSQPVTPSIGSQSSSMPSLPVLTHTGSAISVGGTIPVRYHSNMTFNPLPFHAVKGRNVCLSSDKTIAVRLVEEYCNGYVFSHRPLRCGEKLVIQILSVDKAFVGGLAFGMTACDPLLVNPEELPDDSDLLLDRPEYWVVNKDVCSTPDVGDELSFHLTEDGEVRYGKNGHNIATLMHVDKTLPLWSFFDVYGNTQKIKSIGVVSGSIAARGGIPGVAGQGDSGLRVALPPPRNQSPSSTPTPPPRPPPPRSASPSARRTEGTSPTPTPPSLPPKQYRHGNQGPLPPPPPAPGTILTPIPAPGSRPQPDLPLLPTNPFATAGVRPVPSPAPQTPVSSSQSASPAPVAQALAMVRPTRPPVTQDDSEEAADNASNECSVCFEKAVDCVLYTCGHMCVCYECALDIKANQGALCPICRQVIKDIIKIYRS